MPIETEVSLKTGDKAPDFSLPSSTGKNIALKDLKGKNVILYFYPKDDTPGCTKEACDFRDKSKLFEKENTVILGVSFDNLKSHEKFIQKYKLPFTLLADEIKETAKSYGVYKLKSFMGKSYWGIERTTFWIDGQGKIAAVWPKVKVEGHIQEILSAMEGR